MVAPCWRVLVLLPCACLGIARHDHSQLQPPRKSGQQERSGGFPLLPSEERENAWTRGLVPGTGCLTLITGAGRSGTSFLTALLTNLKLPTTDRVVMLEKERVQTERPAMRAEVKRSANVADDETGHEMVHFFPPGALLRKQGARIFKSPAYSEQDFKHAWLADPCVCHVIVPLRAANLTAQSRAEREESGKIQSGNFVPSVKSAAEELWHDRALTADLVTDLAQHDIPFTTLAFPRHTTDGEYAWTKLQWLLSRHSVAKDTFLAAHQALFDPAVAADEESVPAALEQCPSRVYTMSELSRTTPHFIPRCSNDSVAWPFEWIGLAPAHL